MNPLDGPAWPDVYSKQCRPQFCFAGLDDLAPLAELAAVGLLALAVRGTAVTAQLGELSADPDAYRTIAVNLRASGVFARSDLAGPAFPTAYRPPLYPFLLAALGNGSAIPESRVAVLHVLLGAATAVGTFAIARKIGLQAGAWGGALFTIFDPLLMHQSWLVMTETLAAALTVAALAALLAWSQCASWQRAALAGIILGLCVLCRPTYLVWIGLVVLAAIAWSLWRRSKSWPWWHALVIAATAGLVVAPWTIRNALIFGRPIATTTHGGYTLLLGNNPYFYRYLHERWWTDAWHADEFHFQWLRRREAQHGESFSLDSPQQELADEAAAYQWARESIAAAPGDFVLACAYRCWQLASPLPSRLDSKEALATTLARYAVALWYVGLYALVMLSSRSWNGRERRELAIWSLTLLAAFVGVHTFDWTNLRMRAPLMPVLCIAAGMGLERAIDRTRR